MKYLAIHHSAVSLSQAPSQLVQTDKYHGQKFGMKSSLGYYIGYNFFIDGKAPWLLQARRIGEETAAQVGHNCDVESRCDTISVCLAGDFNIEYPTERQIKVLQILIMRMWKLYPNIEVTFHRNLQPNRTCPGNLFTLSYLKNKVLTGNLRPLRSNNMFIRSLIIKFM